MVDLASLVVRLEAETARYQRELERARGQLARFEESTNVSIKNIGAAVGAAAAAVATGLVAMTKSAIDTADSLNDMSKVTGVSVESLSQLSYAAGQSGTDLEGLSTGLKKFNQQIAEAQSGGKKAADAFAQIGVSVTDAKGALKPTEQLLLEVADKFAMFRDGAGKTALAIDLFGKSGAALIPFLNNGERGIRALMKAADDLGLTITKKTAVAADQFNDNLDDIKKKISAVGYALAERLLPTLDSLTGKLSATVTDTYAVPRFLESLDLIFKTLASSAAIAGGVISEIGRKIGSFFAITTALAKGEGERAAEIYQMGTQDALDAEIALSQKLGDIWEDRAASYNDSLKRYNTGRTDPAQDTRPNLPPLKKPVDLLQEVEITLKKKQGPSELDQYFDELDKRTRTSVERIIGNYRELRAALKIQLDENKINLEEYNTRLKEIENGVLFELTKGPAKVKEAVEKQNEYFLEAARNTQDIIASTFESLATGADVSFKSIVQSFAQMIIRLTAQAAAANLATKLFGDTSAKDGGTGGAIGAFLGLIGFGGPAGATPRDSGGRGYPGMAYAIGRGAQPEVFVPDTSGSFYPAGKSGGAGVTNNFIIAGDMPISRRTQMQVAAAASRGVARANRRNN